MLAACALSVAALLNVVLAPIVVMVGWGGGTRCRSNEPSSVYRVRKSRPKPGTPLGQICQLFLPCPLARC